MPVVLFDESLSSAHAADALDASGSRRRGAIDSVAAAMILQGYFNAQGKGAVPVRPQG